MKPIHKHDCTRCVYLGTYVDSGHTPQSIDCYVCLKPDHPSLHSILGRWSDEGAHYYSSHPPEAFQDSTDYLLRAQRWYMFALAQMMRLGYYRPEPITLCADCTNHPASGTDVHGKALCNECGWKAFRKASDK